MRRESLAAAAAAALFAAAGAWAQQAPDFLPGQMGRPNVVDERDWKEQDVPPPPALRTEGLVSVDVSGGSQLRWGIDPQSVAVGSDRIVRYVVVASTASAMNAAYEGINCERGEYRVYARSMGQGWRGVETEWKSLFDGGEARHVRAIARAGACQGRSPNGGAAQIVRDLRTPPDRKFGGSTAP